MKHRVVFRIAVFVENTNGMTDEEIAERAALIAEKDHCFDHETVDSVEMEEG